MTPLWGKKYEPEDRPTAGELAGAIIFVIVLGFGAWFADIIKNFPPQLPQ